MVHTMADHSIIFLSVSNMSKYDSLWVYISTKGEDKLTLSYENIKEITGTDIDHSFLTYKKELLTYGYNVSKISMKNKTVLFEKTNKD